MRELFALTILRIINLGFASQHGKNPNYISFENKKGQKIYVENTLDYISVSAYKVSRVCFSKKIKDSNEIEIMVNELKEKIFIEDKEY